MQNFRRAAIAVIMFCAFLPSRSQAQFQVNLMGSHLSSAERGSSFNDGIWGPAATIRYFVNPNIAVGIAGRYYSKSESTQVGNITAKGKATAIVATGQIEYFFLPDSPFRPYVGVEAGLFHGRSEFEINAGTVSSFSGSSSNFGLGPRAGLQYAFTPNFGVNADASYQFVFDGGRSSKTLLLSAGVFFKFGNR